MSIGSVRGSCVSPLDNSVSTISSESSDFTAGGSSTMQDKVTSDAIGWTGLNLSLIKYTETGGGTV